MPAATTTTIKLDEVDWLPVRGADLTPGMTLFRKPTGKKEDLDVRSLGKRIGFCSKGVHFDGKPYNACYDNLSTWWTPVRREQRGSPKPRPPRSTQSHRS